MLPGEGWAEMDAAVLVVGAGPAGLAVAACLRRRGIEPLVVDRGSAVGDSWRARYDRLHLHTPRIQSGLPGLRIPPRFGRWVARDDMVRYLRGYARHHGLTPRFGVAVRRLDRASDGWAADTGDGTLLAEQVVLACGYSRVPVMPAWADREAFAGELLHAAAYRSPEPFVRKDVLVVGTGNTGAEIAADLAEGGAGCVWLAVRTPPNVVPRELGPIPATLLGISQDFAPAWLIDPVNRILQRRFIGDLTPYGLPAPRRGVVAQMRLTDVIPIIDVGLVEQLRAGRVTPVAAVDHLDGAEVALVDGSHLAPDVVIAATGYARGLEPIVGHLGVVDARGRPLVHGRRTHPAAPGLRFVGLSNPLKGLLLQINLDARAAAAAIARDRRATAASPGTRGGHLRPVGSARGDARRA
jgi:putative flavoprotein involved in K+ transport